MLETVISKGWSVRETETAVRAWVERNAGSARQREPIRHVQAAEFAEPEQRLRRALATNVAISRSTKGTGSIRIDFSSDDQLAELLDRIAGESLY